MEKKRIFHWNESLLPIHFNFQQQFQEPSSYDDSSNIYNYDTESTKNENNTNENDNNRPRSPSTYITKENFNNVTNKNNPKKHFIHPSNVMIDDYLNYHNLNTDSIEDEQTDSNTTTTTSNYINNDDDSNSNNTMDTNNISMNDSSSIQSLDSNLHNTNSFFMNDKMENNLKNNKEKEKENNPHQFLEPKPSSKKKLSHSKLPKDSNSNSTPFFSDKNNNNNDNDNDDDNDYYYPTGENYYGNLEKINDIDDNTDNTDNNDNMNNIKSHHKSYSFSMKDLKKEMLDNFCLLLLDVNKVYYSNFDYFPLKIREYTRTYAIQDEIMMRKTESSREGYPYSYSLSHEPEKDSFQTALAHTYSSLDFNNLSGTKFLHSNRQIHSPHDIPSSNYSNPFTNINDNLNRNINSTENQEESSSKHKFEKWTCTTINYAISS